MGGKFTVPLGNSDLSFSQKQFIVDSDYSFAICKEGENVSTIFDLKEIVLWHQNNPNRGERSGEFEIVPENVILSPPIAKLTDKNISCDSTPVEDIWENHSNLKIIKLRQGQNRIKSESDMNNFQSLYMMRISSFKSQEDIDNYKEDIMQLFEIVEPTKAEVERSKRIAFQSRRIRNFQNIFRSYFNDLLIENNEQQVLYYLQDFKKGSSGNRFDSAISRILSFDVSQKSENMLFSDDDFTVSFVNTMISLFTTCQVLTEIVFQNKYRNQYENIHTIHLITSKGDMVMTPLKNDSTFEYMLQGNVLTIYNEKIMPFEFSKNEYVYNEDVNISNEDALKNYLYLLLSYKNFNVQSKLFVIFCVLYIFYISMLHFLKMEYFVTNNVLLENEDMDKMIQNMTRIFGNISAKNLGYHSRVVNAKCSSTCPVILKLFGAEDTENSPDRSDPSYKEWANSDARFVPLYVPQNMSIEDDYFIEIRNVEYTITNAVYDQNDTSTEKKLVEVKLMAVGSNDNSCRAKSMNMLPIDITAGQNVRVNLKKKNITDIKSDYTHTGNELHKLNSILEKYKRNINRLSAKNDNQLRMMKNIDIRSYIYYVIFAIIAISGIGIFVFDINQIIKLYVMIAILAIIMIMNIVNYFLNYDVIEGFHALKKKKEHFENQTGSDFIIKYEFINQSLANTNSEDYALKNVGNMTLVLETADSPSHVMFNGSSYLEIPNQNCDLSVFSVEDFTIEFSMYIPSDVLVEQESFTIIDTYSKDANNHHKGWFIELTKNNLNVNVAIDEKRGNTDNYQMSNKVDRNSYVFDKFDEWVTVRIDVNKSENTYNVTCMYSTEEESNIQAESVTQYAPTVFEGQIVSTDLALGTPINVRIGNRNQGHIGDKDYIIRNGVKMDFLRYITKRENIRDGVCKNGGMESGTDAVIEVSIEDKKSFVNNSNNDIVDILSEILKKYMVYLLSSQSDKLYKSLTGSLKNEMRTFSGYEQMYKYKIESDEKSLNAMKHDMIQKTGMINFLSVSFLVVAVMALLYVYINTNKYNEILIGIVVILLLINLYQYYYRILHPVRTKAINKYWYSISDDNEKIMS